MRKTVILSFLALFFACAATAALAQGGPQDTRDPQARKKTDYTARPDKKRTGFIFNRSPDKATAQEQWSYIRELLQAGNTNRAAAQSDMLVRKWHESPEAPQAQLLYAKLLDQTGDYWKAFDEYQYLIAWYAGTFKHEEVLDRQFRIANYLLSTKSMWFFDAPERALPLFQQVMKSGGTWTNAPKIQFSIGQIYETMGDNDEAIKAYELIQTRYPESEYAADAAYRRSAALYNIATKYPRDEVACRDAMSALIMSLRDYPRNEAAAEAQRQLDELKTIVAKLYHDRATFYDKIAHKPAAAVIAYTDFVRTFPSSELAPAARDRIDELNKQLENSNEK